MFTALRPSTSMLATSRQELEAALDQTKRSIRFARDEAVLRRRIVRLYIELDARPQTLTVEYGPDADFLLPDFLQEDVNKLSLEEKKERNKEEKKLNQSFSPIREYQDGAFKFNDNVIIAGIGTTLTGSHYTEGNVSLFFYPTGESDGAFLAFTTADEMATLSYRPYGNNIEEEFIPTDEEFADDEAMETYYRNEAKEGFEQWIK